jgi:hypothetical protein
MVKPCKNTKYHEFVSACGAFIRPEMSFTIKAKHYATPMPPYETTFHHRKPQGLVYYPRNRL